MPYYFSYGYSHLIQALKLKSSLRVFSEALRLPFWNTKGGSAFALASKCRQNFLRIPENDCLQHCKLLSADFSPPYRFNCLWACSFHFSFHDLRLLRYAFQYADHLVVLNLILLVVPTIPRFESVRIVKLQKLGAIRLSNRLGEFVNTPN
jgi:hypothetical protein